jgi:hypothetical protein
MRIVLVGIFCLLLCGSAHAQDSLNVTKVGEMAYWNYAYAVVVSGDYAYVADFSCGLRVINVSDPSSPFEVGYYLTPGAARDVAVSGDYAYMADDVGLRVVNVSDPSSPYEVGYYDTPHQALGVAVSGDYAYVADNDAGLRVVNVTDPSNPFETGYYDTPDDACDVAVSGNYAYVADGRTSSIPPILMRQAVATHRIMPVTWLYRVITPT